MRVDLERCPDAIRHVVSTVECQKCATKQGTGLAAVVRYQPPMYFIQLTCLKCGGKLQVTMMGPGPQPAPAETVEPAAEPAWYAHLESSK